MGAIGSLFVTLALYLNIAFAANVSTICKCDCVLDAANSTMNAIENCALCSKAFCSNVSSCYNANMSHLYTTLTASPTVSPLITEGDWNVSCYQRGSYKDEAIIITFIVAVSTLLVAAALKPYAIRIYNDHIERGAYAFLRS
ncbi:hypothetical protein SeMB42_g00062 [Synchytrium endobioticum]|uniref:Uncharacterized protein n=1 Tax=Synchytrium endobioticum TaxID=286115 RepID=A0A507DTE0_9FUNG|nr:hypothetical protein SeMB42_g00062 [Synchytrium endobioticum]